MAATRVALRVDARAATMVADWAASRAAKRAAKRAGTRVELWVDETAVPRAAAWELMRAVTKDEPRDWRKAGQRVAPRVAEMAEKKVGQMVFSSARLKAYP